MEGCWGRLTFPARFSSQLTAQVARQGGARAVACLGEGEGGRFLVGATGVGRRQDGEGEGRGGVQ
jgi:hypothetical protein